MTALSIKIELDFELDSDDIATMVDTNVYRSISPWIAAITRLKDDEEGIPRWKFRYDGPMDNEGSGDSKGTFDARQILGGFAAAVVDSQEGKHHGFCCLDEMLSDKSLGIGCSQDTDVILQYTLLGDLVYG